MKAKKHPKNRPWHALPVEDVYEALSSSERGLSEQEAEQRLSRHGANKLTAARGRSPIRRFLSQFHNVLIYVLLIAGAITAAIGHWIDSGVIVGMVLINAFIDYQKNPFRRITYLWLLNQWAACDFSFMECKGRG
jgi:magnesium-transporting ATPase (P-type)